MSPGYKCLVIDDDPTITNLIEHYCSKTESIEYCLACNNSVDGLKLISQQDFDIVFLDFNMPDLNGQAILDIKKDNSKVIMISSEAEFAVETYNYPEVIDYLLKPIKFDRFLKAIEKLNQNFIAPPKSTNHYFVKDGNKWVKMNLDDVHFIRSDSNYVHWHSSQKSVISIMNLKDLEKELPSNFKRVHRSFIINTNWIEEISKDTITIMKQKIPVGNQYKNLIDDLIRPM